MTRGVTLHLVSDRTDIPKKVVEAVSRVVAKILADDFGGVEKWGAQSRAEEATGISQTQISDLVRGKVGKLGLGTVLALREYLKSRGRPHSVDEILGFSGATSAQPLEELLRNAASTIETERAEAAARLAASQARVNAERAEKARRRAPKRARKKQLEIRRAGEAARAKKAAPATEESVPAPRSVRGTGTHGRGH